MAMSKRTFNRLGRGDVVLFGKHRKPRIVLWGPRDTRELHGIRYTRTGKERNEFIVFAYLVRSSPYFGHGIGSGATTCYLYTDVSHLLTKARGRRAREITEIEKARLRSFGVDLGEAFQRELREQRRLKRLGLIHSVCKEPGGSRSLWPSSDPETAPKP